MRLRIHEERRAEAEERANLKRQNHELRMENMRLQSRRSRSITKSYSRSTRREMRRNSPTINAGNNIQEEISNPNEEYRENRERADDRYVPQNETFDDGQNGGNQENEQSQGRNDQDGEGNREVVRIRAWHRGQG